MTDMKLETYNRIMIAVAFTTAIFMAIGILQNSFSIAVASVAGGIIALYLSRRGLTEIVHDERTILIHSKAASATVAITTVTMAVVGLSLVFLSGHGTGNYEEIGYLLAYQGTMILCLNSFLSYYYRKKLGG